MMEKLIFGLQDHYITDKGVRSGLPLPCYSISHQSRIYRSHQLRIFQKIPFLTFL